MSSRFKAALRQRHLVIKSSHLKGLDNHLAKFIGSETIEIKMHYIFEKRSIDSILRTNIKQIEKLIVKQRANTLIIHHSDMLINNTKALSDIKTMIDNRKMNLILITNSESKPFGFSIIEPKQLAKLAKYYSPFNRWNPTRFLS